MSRLTKFRLFASLTLVVTLVGCGGSESTVVGADDQSAFTDPELNPAANPDYDPTSGNSEQE